MLIDFWRSARSNEFEYSWNCSRKAPPSLGEAAEISLAVLDSDAPVYHLGIYREKVTLAPVECKSRRLLAARYRQVLIIVRLFKTAPLSSCRPCLPLGPSDCDWWHRMCSVGDDP